MLANENTRSKKLLDKVYDYLETIDVTKLSMNDLKDYLELVQTGQFLESFGTMPFLSSNPYGFNRPVYYAKLDATESGEGAESKLE